MTALAPSERLGALEPAATRLHLRFGDAVDRETVARVLDECYDRLQAHATVTSYLVILAERTAAQRLRSMS
ncbi:hypothetical protein HC251_07325 [Iamia sp. SCSIO 61187]|uniref:three-helix bundle dimerization domain-containing protein n=1 Tax=Iamia sp. SCSIO 61187 TaxID=2722752 RepID=UPI001C62E5EF|nr:hypothetical protein [Iamia sp. SCSIO 61187]QYG92268.1 hypothetical protein HC251_07325 [Iamia sp. SCSIO 61187]